MKYLTEYRITLARQLLLRRERLDPVAAIERLAGLLEAETARFRVRRVTSREGRRLHRSSCRRGGLPRPSTFTSRGRTPGVKARCQGSIGSYDQVTSSWRASGIRSQPVSSQPQAMSGPQVTSTLRCMT